MPFSSNEQTIYEQQAVTILVLTALIATHPNKEALLGELERVYEPFVARQLNLTEIGDSAAETARQVFALYIDVLKRSLGRT
jgi:hypothetical protein